MLLRSEMWGILHTVVASNVILIGRCTVHLLPA